MPMPALTKCVPTDSAPTNKIIRWLILLVKNTNKGDRDGVRLIRYNNCLSKRPMPSFDKVPR